MDSLWDFAAFPGHGDYGNELGPPELVASDGGSRKRPRSTDAALSWALAPDLCARRNWSDSALVIFDGAACTLQPPSPRLFGGDSHNRYEGTGEKDAPDLMASMGMDDDGSDQDDSLEKFFAQDNDGDVEAAAAAVGLGITAAAHVVPYQQQPLPQPPVTVTPSSSSSSGSSEDEEDAFGTSGCGSGYENEQNDDMEALLACLPGASAADFMAGVGGDTGISLHETAFADSAYEEEGQRAREEVDKVSSAPALLLRSSPNDPFRRASGTAASRRRVVHERKRKRGGGGTLRAPLPAEGKLEAIGLPQQRQQQQQQSSPFASCGRRSLRAAAAASVAQAVASLSGIGEDGELRQCPRVNIGTVKQEPLPTNMADATAAARAQGDRAGSDAEAAAGAPAAQVSAAERKRVARAVAGAQKERAAAADHGQHHRQHQQLGHPPIGSVSIKASSCDGRGTGGCDGKLMHIDCLKHQVADLLFQQRQLEAAVALPRGGPGVEAAAAVEVSPEAEAAGRKRSAVRRFLDYRSAGVQDRAAWAELVSESFALVLPVAPYRSCWDTAPSGGQGQNPGVIGVDGHLAGDGGTQRICGIDALVRDTRAILHLVECINARCGYVRPNQKRCNIVFVYRVAPGDTLVSGNQVMCHWRLSTERLCADGGLPRECAVDGMLRCRFDSGEKLCSMEVTYDVLGFTQQLRSLGLLPGMPLPMPITRALSAPAAAALDSLNQGQCRMPLAGPTPPTKVTLPAPPLRHVPPSQITGNSGSSGGGNGGGEMQRVPVGCPAVTPVTPTGDYRYNTGSGAPRPPAGVPLPLPAAPMTPPTLSVPLHGHLAAPMKIEPRPVVSPLPNWVRLGLDGRSLVVGKEAVPPPGGWQYPLAPPAEWHRSAGHTCEGAPHKAVVPPPPAAANGAPCRRHVPPTAYIQSQ